MAFRCIQGAGKNKNNWLFWWPVIFHFWPTVDGCNRNGVSDGIHHGFRFLFTCEFKKKKSIPKRKQISKTLSAAGSVGKAFFPLPMVLCRHCTDWLKGVVLSDVRDDQTHDLFLSFQCPEECWWGKHLYSNRVSLVEPGALFLLHGNGSHITMAVFFISRC